MMNHLNAAYVWGTFSCTHPLRPSIAVLSIQATKQAKFLMAPRYSSLFQVYQIATCPAYYNITEVRAKCENSTQPLVTDNVKLITPVTSTENRITYANEYCAQCHGDWNYQPWTLTYYCSEDVFLNTNSDIGTNNTERDYLWETTQAANHVKFDLVTKTFRSTFNNRNYTCPPSISLPETLRPLARLCIPAISKCSNTSDRQAVERCRSYTSIVYDDNTKYKNRDCAICNGKTKKLPGCKERKPDYSAASSLFSTGNKGSGNANACKDPSVKNKYCWRMKACRCRRAVFQKVVFVRIANSVGEWKERKSADRQLLKSCFPKEL